MQSVRAYVCEILSCRSVRICFVLSERRSLYIVSLEARSEQKIAFSFLLFVINHPSSSPWTGWDGFLCRSRRRLKSDEAKGDAMNRLLFCAPPSYITPCGPPESYSSQSVGRWLMGNAMNPCNPVRERDEMWFLLDRNCEIVVNSTNIS